MKNLIWLFVAPVLYVVSFLTSLVYVILHIISGPVTSSQGQEAMSGPHLPSHGVPQASASGKRSEQPPSLEVSSGAGYTSEHERDSRDTRTGHLHTSKS